MKNFIPFGTIDLSYEDKYETYMCECDICLNPEKYVKKYYITTDNNEKIIQGGTHREPHCIILAPNKCYRLTLVRINSDLDKFEVKEVN